MFHTPAHKQVAAPAAVSEITASIIGTDIVQYELTAGKALEIGLLAKDGGANGCGWFADWARNTPAEKVYVYTFGGLTGGFIYREVADFLTLTEFAERADDMARQIWTELQTAWEERLDAQLSA